MHIYQFRLLVYFWFTTMLIFATWCNWRDFYWCWIKFCLSLGLSLYTIELLPYSMPFLDPDRSACWVFTTNYLVWDCFNISSWRNFERGAIQNVLIMSHVSCVLRPFACKFFMNIGNHSISITHIFIWWILFYIKKNFSSSLAGHKLIKQGPERRPSLIGVSYERIFFGVKCFYGILLGLYSLRRHRLISKEANINTQKFLWV